MRFTAMIGKMDSFVSPEGIILDPAAGIVQIAVVSFLRDIDSGKSVQESGWINQVSVGVDREAVERLVETNVLLMDKNDKVRINFDHREALLKVVHRSRMLRYELEYAFSQADVISKDTERYRNSQSVVTSLEKRLTEDPSKWPLVVSIGWWKMLESSGMPALIKTVLEKGFSPKDWTLKAVSASYHLSTLVAERHGSRPTFSDCRDFLSEMLVCPSLSLEEPQPPGPEDLSKIIAVLDWDQLVSLVPTEVQKAFGFAWTSYFIWNFMGSLPLTDVLSQNLLDSLSSSICDLTGVTEEHTSSAFDRLRAAELHWATEILMMPGGI